MQTQVTAPTGYLISCVTYLVAGDYAVASRERESSISTGTRNGRDESSGPTYRFSEAFAGSPTTVQTGCELTDPVPVVEIEAIVKSGGAAAARFVLGYTMETVPESAPLSCATSTMAPVQMYMLCAARGFVVPVWR